MQKNVLNIFNTDDVLKIFVRQQSTEILIQSNFWLKMYVSYLKKKSKYLWLPVILRDNAYIEINFQVYISSWK